MTALISIRLSEDLLQIMKAHAHTLHLSKTDYIRKTIELMNQEIEKGEREKRLKDASLRVRKESMMINAEFSEIEHDPKS